MNREQQDKIWAELSEESRKVIINEARGLDIEIDEGSTSDIFRKQELEDVFGEHNLISDISYKEIVEKLYEHDCNLIQFLTTTSVRHEKKINAINQLLEVAKYLNSNINGCEWVPDWDDPYEIKYFPVIVEGKIEIKDTARWNWAVVYFPSEELAMRACKILGEECILTALGSY